MATETVIDKREKALLTHELLQLNYGELEIKARRSAMHELISTMLSHRTTHANEEKAYYRMLERFGSWEGVRDAPLDELIDAIASSNFPEVKAPRIKQVVGMIIAERGEANIDFLQHMPLDEALAWLVALPGVGLKTATLVLLFNFHRPVIPVDTHVHRVTQRLGVIGEKTTAEKAHAVLLDMLPKEAKVLYNFHVHFLWHGQRICTWANPKCKSCVVKDLCDWYKANRKVE